MCKQQNIYKILSGPFVFTVLLLSCNVSSAQVRLQRHSIKKISPQAIAHLRIPELSRDTLSGLLSSLVPFSPAKNKDIIFYDTLKVRASKHNFTKKIFDFVVVNPDTIYKKRFLGASETNYVKSKGKRIRHIEIRRLNVFGSDINYPLTESSKEYEKLLNKTHFNTNENIIRKNLLFSEGDRISPLILSDNERLLRRLPFIGDARINITPVSDEEVDVTVFTKDVYSLGGAYVYKGLKAGSVSVFDKNIFGIGHEFGVDIPFDYQLPHSPGFGVHYIADNIRKTFVNLNVFFLYGLGKKTYGFDLSRRLVSSTSKYAGGISIRQMYTTEDFDTLVMPLPLKYNLQDYWLMRSFLVNKESVSRIIIGARYFNNNVFEHPVISPDSYYNLQKYKIFLGSVALSVQKYSKANLIYSYGRTEDIPYGGMLRITSGREYNEFKQRTYLGTEASYGNKNAVLGYFYVYGGISTYVTRTQTEQGILSLRMNYFSNLLNWRNFRIRNFVYLNYTRGFGRYSNEYLRFSPINGFSGFKNDTIRGNQRLTVSLESVLFSPVNLYGFRFAFFGFTDLSFLSGTNEILGRGYALSSIGLGVRIRNDNLIFNTLQIRIGYFPNPPSFSRISPITVSGEQLLHPENFDSGPPSVIPFE